MSDTPEPLAAVLAEMRDGIHTGRADIIDYVNDRLRSYADRIEAAAERERNAHTNDIHDALYKATGIPGNAAAMREALYKAKCVLLVAARFATDDAFTDAEARENLRCVDWDGALAEIDAAIAAPARNCDRFATEDEAREAYWAYREPLEFNDKPFVAITEWLFAPAEGGDHA